MPKTSVKSEYSLIRLILQKKYNAAINESNATDKNQRSITLFGYYDRLIYENIDNWYALRPGIRNFNASYNSPKMFSNEYTLRLVAPDWAKQACVKVQGNENILDYAYFDQFGMTDTKGQAIAPKASIEQFPLFSVLLINCSDKKLKEVSNPEELFRVILDAVVDSVKNSQVSSLKIGIYLSLGYSEFAILFSGNSVHCINEQIDNIRTCLVGPCASSTYTIFGFDGSFINSNIANETVDVTIDFSLLPGKTLENDDFRQFFKHNLTEEEDEAKKLSYTDPVMLMGSTDWRWELKDCELARLLHAYSENTEYNGRLKSFGNDSDLFKLVYTKLKLKQSKSSPKQSKQSSEYYETIAPKQGSQDDALEGEYNKFNALYNDLISKYFVHRRSLDAIQGIKDLYDKVVNSSYGGDVKILTKPFFYDFLKFMKQLMDLLNSDGSPKEKNILVKRMMGIDTFLREYVKIFRDFFEPYLFAIYRSDHAFFEGQSLVHPSIGSAAKLLFSYNRVLYAWEEKYRIWEISRLGKGKDKNHAFQGSSMDFTYLVTSGGVDSTDNWDMFDNLSELMLAIKSDSGDRLSRPLVVMMSEAGLYNIEGTLFKLAHEFFHKRGNRMRDKRALAYIRDICFNVAHRIAEWFVWKWMSEKIYRQICKLRHFDRSLKDLDEKVVQDEILLTIEELFVKKEPSKKEDRRYKFVSEIEEDLFQILYDDNTKKIANDSIHNIKLTNQLLGKNLRNTCQTVIKRAWKLDEKGKKPDEEFWGCYTYQPDGGDYRIDTLRKKIACKLYEHGKRLSDLLCIPIVRNKDSSGSNGEEQKIYLLRPSFSIDPARIDESAFTFDRKAEMQGIIETALQDQNMFDTWERLAKECFADCLAVKTMVRNKGDCNDPWGKQQGILSYLLAFLFEVRNPNEPWKNKYSKRNYYWTYRLFIIKELLKWDNKIDTNALEEAVGTWYNTYFYPGQDKSDDKEKYKEKYVRNVLAAWNVLFKEEEEDPKLLKDFQHRYEGLFSYLNRCIIDNASLCRQMHNIHKSILNDRDDTIKSYSRFVFEKWLDIYRWGKDT